MRQVIALHEQSRVALERFSTKMAIKRSKTGDELRERSTPPPVEPAFYFLSLSLQNVRCFGENIQKLNMSHTSGKPARWTILLGNNGTGKTTILQTLAGFEADFTYERSVGFKKVPHPRWTSHDVRNDRSFPLKTAAEIAACSSLKSSAIDETVFSAFYKDVTSLYENSHKDFSWEGDFAFRLKCYGYGASRRLSRNLTESISSLDDPVASLFSDDAVLRNAEDWLLRLDYSASKKSKIREQQERRRAIVEDLLIKILPDVEEIRFTSPTSARPTPAVEFRSHGSWLALHQLGHGYRTLVAWMVDLASRLFERNPDWPNPLAAPAVVLVDEIDLHLHPLWQRKLMRHLSELFPNVQFIVSAHSPLIVQAADEDANVALLQWEGDHVVIHNKIERVEGWRLDQLLTSDLFGLPSARPPQYDKAMERRKQLLTQPKLSAKDRRELEKLDGEIGPLPFGETAQEAKELELLRESIDLLKQNRNGAT